MRIDSLILRTAVRLVLPLTVLLALALIGARQLGCAVLMHEASHRSLLGGDGAMTSELRKEMEQLINARVRELQSAGVTNFLW